MGALQAQPSQNTAGGNKKILEDALLMVSRFLSMSSRTQQSRRKHLDF